MDNFALLRHRHKPRQHGHRYGTPSGAANDIYVVDNTGDVVNEANGGGTDTVLASISFDLTDPVHAIGAIENLTLTGKGAINATGNDLDNDLSVIARPMF